MELRSMVLWDLSSSNRTETETKNGTQSFLTVASVLKALEGGDKIGIKTGVSKSKARLQLGFALISMARVTTKDHLNVHGLFYHLKPW